MSDTCVNTFLGPFFSETKSFSVRSHKIKQWWSESRGNSTSISHRPRYFPSTRFSISHTAGYSFLTQYQGHSQIQIVISTVQITVVFSCYLETAYKILKFSNVRCFLCSFFLVSGQWIRPIVILKRCRPSALHCSISDHLSGNSLDPQIIRRDKDALPSSNPRFILVISLSIYLIAFVLTLANVSFPSFLLPLCDSISSIPMSSESCTVSTPTCLWMCPLGLLHNSGSMRTVESIADFKQTRMLSEPSLLLYMFFFTVLHWVVSFCSWKRPSSIFFTNSKLSNSCWY